MADPVHPQSPTFKHPDSVPFIYFDIAPNFGVLAGAVEIELAARTLIPAPDGKTLVQFVGTGHLRCSPAAAAHLREALNKALEMLEHPQEAATAVGRLN
jgi:hypothetical protein